jgi:2-polyprenyl-3-methyl-5-hydroxy-6-metoxy-1,4-benzoquinol methylase
VGCGVGLLSLRLAENGFDTYGTDISENMIHKAIEHLSTKFNNSNDRFRISQNGNLPFQGISFQIITAIADYNCNWCFPLH